MARPRKPTALLELAGAFKKNPQRKRVGEPKPDTPVGNPPSHLDKDQRKAWREIARQCHPGVLTGMDRAALEIVACSIAWLWKNPDASVTERKSVLAMLGKFGMTPADRTNLAIEPDKPTDGGFRPTRFQSLNPERDRRK